jgi:hypothetical protein
LQEIEEKFKEFLECLRGFLQKALGCFSLQIKVHATQHKAPTSQLKRNVKKDKIIFRHFLSSWQGVLDPRVRNKKLFCV